MRNVLSISQEIDRLADHVLPGRQTAARNEALRQVVHRLRRVDARTSPLPRTLRHD